MKKEISPIAVIVALVALVAVLGYFGYRAMTPEPVQGMDRAEFKRRMQQYQDSTSMKGSGGGAP
ncbi:MAG: hypothetical protein SFU56_17515, partial [Capsulimonadales bacterium]|nr:hypothetical protein [Capsulimonadales bacterium]